VVINSFQNLVYLGICLTTSIKGMLSSTFLKTSKISFSLSSFLDLEELIGKGGIVLFTTLHFLLDLGASVNLLPYSVFQSLNLGELKPTSVTLLLADRSIKVPRGIVEDVLVQVDKFIYPVDFIILDTQPVERCNSFPIILRRLFLATSNALINCRNGLMKLSFGNMTLEMNIFNICKQPGDDNDS